jgi:shikimate kinase
MKKTAKQFRQWKNKSITLLGMSGVGKTTFSTKLPSQSWFHYSGDYRIGTKYLDEPILDYIKSRAMEHEFLGDLLRRDAIYIRNNISVDHLQPLSLYLGKVGNPALGGLGLDEFKRRQRLFFEAEIKAMADVREFMAKSRNIYGYPNFINDAGGSICYLSDEECWHNLSELTVILYLQTSEEMEKTLVERARKKPKPVFYDEKFLDQHLRRYQQEKNLKSADEIVPDEFVQWVFPELISFRKPRYERLADQYGHTVDAGKIFGLRDEADIIDLVCDSMAEQES